MLLAMKRYKNILRKIMKKARLEIITLTWYIESKQWKPTGTTVKSDQMKGN